jgi:hypothetical protein
MTTSQSLFWIDRGRWAGLLARVIEDPAPAGWQAPKPNVRPVIASPRAGASPSSPPARPQPGTAPLPDAPPPPPPAKSVGYRPFTSSSQQLEERLQALMTWIEDCVPCRAAFVADDNGLPVVEHLGTDPGHVAAASSILLLLASVRTLMRDSGGWLSLQLGAAVLNVVEVATRWGRFGLGVVSDDALPREFLVVLCAAVERAFHGESSQGEAT